MYYTPAITTGFATVQRLFVEQKNWTVVRDGNLKTLDIFKRHYSFRKWRKRNGKNGNRFIGPGESIILLSVDEKALFTWVKQKYRKDDQRGICCSIFRNEGSILSSKLILEAEEIARWRYPHERFFTFIDPDMVCGTNPGYCFKCAGWRVCGESSKGLIILEKLVTPVP